MLATLNAMADSIYAIDEALRKASDSERELARIQALRLADRIGGDEQDLLTLIPALALEGPVADSIADALGSFLSREAAIYDIAIDRNLARIQELQALARRFASKDSDSDGDKDDG